MQAVWVSEIPPKSATLETPLGSENPTLTGHICSKNMMKSPKTYKLKQPPNSYCMDIDSFLNLDKTEGASDSFGQFPICQVI